MTGVQTCALPISNLGSGIITERFGSELSGSGELSEMVVENTRDEVMELMKRTLKPEFLNRIDEVVMFTPLTRRQTLQIVDIQLSAVERMLREVGMELKVTPVAREWLADAGYDPTYGARPVKRAIQTHLVNALSRSILAGSVERDRPIEVDAVDGEIQMKNA